MSVWIAFGLAPPIAAHAPQVWRRAWKSINRPS